LTTVGSPQENKSHSDHSVSNTAKERAYSHSLKPPVSYCTVQAAR
jgi:hypothetical protein